MEEFELAKESFLKDKKSRFQSMLRDILIKLFKMRRSAVLGMVPPRGRTTHRTMFLLQALTSQNGISLHALGWDPGIQP